MAWTQSPCPKCGRLEKHENMATMGGPNNKIRAHTELKLCAVCLMCGADAVDSVQMKKQDFLDPKATILSICRKYNLKQSDLAFALRMRPEDITHAKHGLRPFTKHAFDIIKEKYSECLIQKKKAMVG